MKRLTATIVSALAVCMVMILCGCGGASSTNNIVAGQRGALKITVQWPVAPAAKSRLIPVLTNAIIVAVTTDDGTSVGGTTLTRPAAGVNTTSATLDQLPVGHVTVTATALANPDVNYAGNTPQAIGSVSATVVYNQTITTPDLVMNSTITKVGVTPSPVTAMAGGAPVVLTVSAMDKSGNVVMAPATNFTWASDNSAAATITRTGLTATLQGLKIGTAKITVTESDSKVVSAPVAVTVTGGTTSSGPNILIADTGNNRIVGLDAIPPATTLTYNDSGSGTAFGGVIGVAHDSSGRIYVADFYAKLIRIDDFTGKNRVAYAPSGISLNFIYVDKAGKIYWLDNNGAVNRIDDMTGANHLTFGANILGGSPTSIAVDSSNRIYVWDGSFRVIRFDDMTGKNIVYYGAQGSGVGHFNTLSSGSLSIDSTNRIYIADQSNKRIVRIDDMTGANWTEFDIPADSGTAVNPDKVSVDSSATPSIYFMVQSTGTVFKCSDMAGTGLTKLGTFANGVTPLHFPSAISVK